MTPKIKKKFVNLKIFPNFIKLSMLLNLISNQSLITSEIKENQNKIYEISINYNHVENHKKNTLLTSQYDWEFVEKESGFKEIYWEKFDKSNSNFIDSSFEEKQKQKVIITTLNRSIVFNNETVGPDVSWLFPPAFKWNKKYKFDFNVRGHNTVIPGPPNRKFFGWNNGDAVGLLSYQFINKENSSFGLNFGLRSLYQGHQAAGGQTPIGEGLSSGFRWDFALSELSGITVGAEQLIHHDGLTDTGRNIYLLASKAWWSSEYQDIGLFPLYIATAGLGTGRMAVGNPKGLCSSITSSGTEFVHRDLCWSPVFSLASVWNHKFSTFFEYNSRFFVLGSSLSPLQNIPLRGTFALILSDHIDNYKLHNFDELNWVFNLSLGF